MNLKEQLLKLSMPLIIGVFSLYYLSTVWDAPWEAKDYSVGLIVGIFVSFMFLLYKDLRNGKSSQVVSKHMSKDDSKRLISILMLALLFVVSIYFLGYYLATLIFLIIAPWLLGYKHKRSIFLTALIVTTLTYILFGLFLHSRLPQGLFFS